MFHKAAQFDSLSSVYPMYTVVPRLCGCCDRALYSITSVLTHSHRSGFNLEFEAPFTLLRFCESVHTEPHKNATKTEVSKTLSKVDIHKNGGF